MSNGPFTVVGGDAAPAKKKRSKAMTGAPAFCRDISGLKDSEYDLSEYAGLTGGEGTVLPRQSEQGGVMDSKNPYGQVVMEGSAAFQQTVNNLLSPKTEEVVSVPTIAHSFSPKTEEVGGAPTEVSPTTQAVAGMPKIAGAKTYVPPVQDRQAEADNDIKYLEALAGIEEGNISSPPTRQPAAPLPMGVPPELISFERKRIRVRISGSKFGKYKGHYLHIVDDPKYLILFYDVDDAGFEPPITERDEPITVSCEDQEYKVYYMGMDFDLKMNNLGMQVYIKHKEHKE